MKQILILVFLFSFVLNADEIQRIESIVSDIDNIQNNLDQEKDKNKKLNIKLNLYSNKIKFLNNQINILKSKIKLNKTNEKEEDNLFPCLTMKEKYKNEQSVSYFKASTFRTNAQVKIYDSINGSTVSVWNDKTSFTSNQRAGKWIKITGLFVHKIWQPAGKELWVKSCDVFNRIQVSE